MPASWDFEIYEDSPEEEASNLMEHSTQSLDLSSDDELTKAQRDDRGKENEAPEGYDAPTASRQTSPALPAPTRVKKTEFVRRKITEMDDGERSPLSDLDTDEFIPEGLTKDAHIILDATPEKAKLDVKSLFAVSPAGVASTATKNECKEPSKLSMSSTPPSHDDAAKNVVIWEDDVDNQGEQVVGDSTGAPMEESVGDITSAGSDSAA